MAKAPAKPDEGGEAPKKKSKLLLILGILLLIVVVLVGGAIAALVVLKGGKADNDAAAPAATQSASSGGVDLSKPPTFVPLDPFTVNLRRDEGDHYLQVVAVLRVADAKTGESLKAFGPEIRHRVNLLLSSKLPSQLATPEDRENLATEIAQQVNEALGFPPLLDAAGRPTSNGPVQAVLFNAFIIQ